jgi:hypothetical protein
VRSSSFTVSKLSLINHKLSGYAAQCLALANITIDPKVAALALPDFWDGPTGIFVPTAGLVVTVGLGAMMGVSAIYLLSTM